MKKLINVSLPPNIPSTFLLKERERVRETKNDEFLLGANLTIIILIIIIIND